jgi:hypothetical protein
VDIIFRIANISEELEKINLIKESEVLDNIMIRLCNNLPHKHREFMINYIENKLGKQIDKNISDTMLIGAYIQLAREDSPWELLESV